jgi:hypothetical protein
VRAQVSPLVVVLLVGATGRLLAAFAGWLFIKIIIVAAESVKQPAFVSASLLFSIFSLGSLAVSFDSTYWFIIKSILGYSYSNLSKNEYVKYFYTPLKDEN